MKPSVESAFKKLNFAIAVKKPRKSGQIFQIFCLGFSMEEKS